MRRFALTPTNVPALASAPTLPTLSAGDLYFNTASGLQVYDGTNWNSVSTSVLTMVDAGAFDSIAPYQGGSQPSISADQTLNGGTP